MGRDLSYSDSYGNGLVGDYSPFYNKTLLTTLSISENVTSIRNYAFAGCSNLTAITIPESVTSIGGQAFSGCSNLTAITIPESVTSIGEQAFSGCSSLTSIIVADGNSIYDSRDECNAIIEASSNTLVAGCSSTIIPESVTSIGEWAFSDCSSLTSITIPENVTSIGGYAFEDCNNLYRVFNYSNLSLFAGSSDYGKVAYYAKQIIKGGELTAIGDFQFLTSGDVHRLVNYVGKDTDVKLPDFYNGMRYGIGSYAFYGCNRLTSITIPEDVESIENCTFDNCTALKKVIIEDGEETLSLGYNYYNGGYTNIGEGLFYDCPLESVYIGRNLGYNSGHSYGYSPFLYQSNLTSVTIGENVTNIRPHTFEGCTRISSITSYATVPPICGEQALEYVNKQECVLRVPKGYASTYQTANQWKDFFYIEDVVDVKYTLTFMVDGEAYHTSSLIHNAEIILPEAPTKEGYTFSGWGEVPATMPAEDVTITGFFTINKYLVTFVIDDEVIASDSIEYNAEIIVPEAPVKEGYTFSGWGEVPATMPAEDVKISGSFTPNIYKVYYYVDEELVHTAEVACDEVIPEYVYEPTVKGEVFVGWIGEAYETMPAHDITYKAEIEIRFITLTIDQYGSGTFCSIHDLDFSEVEGLKAYVATGYNTATGVVTLTRVMSAKSGEGLFLKGQPGDYEVPTLKSSESCMQNLLVGALDNTIVNSTSEDGLNANYEYKAKGNDTTPVFYSIVDGSVQNAGKAYLQLPKAWIGTETTRTIGLCFDDEEMVSGDEEQPAIPAVIYDLQGRRVMTPTKGAFIVNGKMVVFK